MAATPSTGFDESVRPEDVAVEEALVEEPDEGEPVLEDGDFPEEANEADVLEQRAEVPVDEDEPHDV